MALEKYCNEVAKIVIGVINITRGKDVAMRNILKHEKDLWADHVKEWCGIRKNDSSELDLNHEFTISAARRSQTRSKTLLNYIRSICTRFSASFQQGIIFAMLHLQKS